MRKLFLLGALASTAMLLTSCVKGGNFLDSPGNDAAPFFIAENQTLEVEATSLYALEAVSAEIGLKSNVSWTGSMPAHTSWVSLSQDSDINLSGQTKQYNLGVYFSDNLDSQPREVTLKFSSKGGFGQTVLKQKAFTPILKVDGEITFNNVPAKGETYSVDIVSNLPWTAAALTGASAAVELVNNAGIRSGALVFNVGENDDPELEPTSQIKISAEGCTDIIITINQCKATI